MARPKKIISDAPTEPIDEKQTREKLVARIDPELRGFVEKSFPSYPIGLIVDMLLSALKAYCDSAGSLEIGS